MVVRKKKKKRKEVVVECSYSRVHGQSGGLLLRSVLLSSLPFADEPQSRHQMRTYFLSAALPSMIEGKKRFTEMLFLVFQFSLPHIIIDV